MKKHPVASQFHKNSKSYIDSELHTNSFSMDNSLHSKLKILESVLSDLKLEHGLSQSAAIKLLEKKESQEILIPVSVFSNIELGQLESITGYLRLEYDMQYSKIASLLKKDPGVIGVTFRNVQRKLGKLAITTRKTSDKQSETTKSAFDKSSEQKIPLSELSSNILTVFECLVFYLKYKLRLSFHEIAQLTNRDDRTVWTVYHNALKKRGELI